MTQYSVWSEREPSDMKKHILFPEKCITHIFTVFEIVVIVSERSLIDLTSIIYALNLIAADKKV